MSESLESFAQIHSGTKHHYHVLLRDAHYILAYILGFKWLSEHGAYIKRRTECVSWFLERRRVNYRCAVQFDSPATSLTERIRMVRSWHLSHKAQHSLKKACYDICKFSGASTEWGQGESVRGVTWSCFKQKEKCVPGVHICTLWQDSLYLSNNRPRPIYTQKRAVLHVNLHLLLKFTAFFFYCRSMADIVCYMGAWRL